MSLLVPAILTTSCAWSTLAAASGQARPWWDDLPLIVQTSSAKLAQDFRASAVICGAADDPTWGTYAQRVRMVDARGRVEQIHNAGMKALSWIEAFGTAGSCYVAQLKKDANGAWIKHPADPSLTRVFRNHWGWQHFDGRGYIRWIGVHNYFDDEDHARPYTCTHHRYGCRPMTYPDGSRASGYTASREDPRSSRVYDAGCAKNVLGNVTFDYRYHALVNEIDPATGRPRGPTTGLLEVNGKYSGNVSPGKDSACPIWIDYVRASVKQALDAGIDGLWCDNFSPWDSFGSQPVLKAFGEWSVAGFRQYLGEHFAPDALLRMGVTDLPSFDVRDHLRRQCASWGGTHTDLRDRVWRDARWLDHALWRAYVIYKRQTGTAALSALYHAIREAAGQADRPEFLVAGNDIPIFGLGWPRGDLDMVSTELGWGWGLSTGTRGLMPPPAGSYLPVYKLAREHARSRWVNVWMYVPKEQGRKPNMARVLFHQALANHALPMPHPANPRHAGDQATARECFAFARSVRDVLAGRSSVDQAGLYYSSSSQLARMTPGGTLDFNNQPHIFAFWGWGTALSQLHYTFRAVPEWKLTRQVLEGLRLLIIPNAVVFDPDRVRTLKRWVEDGGALIVTARTGERLGEAANFDRSTDGLTLACLTQVARVNGAPARRFQRMGKGCVLYLRESLGMEFYPATHERPKLLREMDQALASAADRAAVSPFPDVARVPWFVGLTAYQDVSARRVCVDVNNTRIDAANDAIIPTPRMQFAVTLPSWLQGRQLRLRTLSPQQTAQATFRRTGQDLARIDLPSIELYACVVIEAMD